MTSFKMKKQRCRYTSAERRMASRFVGEHSLLPAATVTMKTSMMRMTKLMKVSMKTHFGTLMITMKNPLLMNIKETEIKPMTKKASTGDSNSTLSLHSSRLGNSKS